MRFQAGDFAVAEFGPESVCHGKVPCLITGRSADGTKLEVIRWTKVGQKLVIFHNALPDNELEGVGLRFKGFPAEDIELLSRLGRENDRLLALDELLTKLERCPVTATQRDEAPNS